MNIIKRCQWSRLSTQRSKQLEQEEKIDEKIKTLPCYQISLNYYLKMRRLNRFYTNKIINSPFYNYMSVYEDHLQLVDSIQDTVLHAENLCEILPDLTHTIDLLVESEPESQKE